MDPKILREAFDRLTQIEEARPDQERWRDKSERKPEEERAGLEMPGKMHDKYDYKPYKKYNEKVKEDESSNDQLQDGIDELRMIQEEFYELRDRLSDAIRSYAPSKLAYWQSYGLAQLDIIIGSDEYASAEESINTLIDSIKEEMEGDEFDGEDQSVRPSQRRR